MKKLLESVNGQILRGLAVLGAVLIGLLMILITDWVAWNVFGIRLDDVWEAVIAAFVLLSSAGVGLKYAQKHDVRKGDG